MPVAASASSARRRVICRWHAPPRVILVLLILGLAGHAAASSRLARLMDVDHSSEANRTRIVLRVSRAVEFAHGEVPLLEEPGQPRRLFIDLKQTRLPNLKGESYPIKDVRVLQVRTGQYDANCARVVLDLAGDTGAFKIFSLQRPFRVVIDVFTDPEAASTEPAPVPEAADTDTAPKAGPEGDQPLKGREPAPPGGPSLDEILAEVTPPKGGDADSAEPSNPPSRQAVVDFPFRRIVLDPGHGGGQPGAVGREGLREKDVVLDVSRRLKRLAEREIPGLEVLLTRGDDRTLTLEERTAFANKVEADLFISIHANAHPRRSRFGIETFYLNVTSDRYANRLAQVENDTSEKSLSDLQFILADLTRMANIDESRELARYLQGGMVRRLGRGWDMIRDLGVKNALFYVLLGAKMPACLVEISFLSNPREEKRLAEPGYRDAVAEGLLDGIEAFAAELKKKQQ